MVLEEKILFQAKMEAGFGADFSNVKVHADGQSDRLNDSIQAKAFTTGTNIFFKQGEYNPNSRGGQELLAHVTHVVQQSGQKGTIQRFTGDKKKKVKDAMFETLSVNIRALQACSDGIHTTRCDRRHRGTKSIFGALDNTNLRAVALFE